MSKSWFAILYGTLISVKSMKAEAYALQFNIKATTLAAQ
jgi:hypothetical protein